MVKVFFAETFQISFRSPTSIKSLVEVCGIDQYTGSVLSLDKPSYEVKSPPHPAVTLPSTTSRNKGCHECSSFRPYSSAPPASKYLLP
ncbi:hypothetical protein LDENG_00111980 [Lucifuga dentata]|nr:hypothetical protein LDENG_00111980 [Lucifuga dentata]